MQDMVLLRQVGWLKLLWPFGTLNFCTFLFEKSVCLLPFLIAIWLQFLDTVVQGYYDILFFFLMKVAVKIIYWIYLIICVILVVNASRSPLLQYFSVPFPSVFPSFEPTPFHP